MKTIYLFSNCYPFGMVAESFLKDELLVASKIPCCKIRLYLCIKVDIREIYRLILH